MVSRNGKNFSQTNAAFLFALLYSWLYLSNWLISYSSRANAFTTRLPEMFSSAAVFMRESFSRRSTYIGPALRLNSHVMNNITGVSAIRHSAISQSIVKKNISDAEKSTTHSTMVLIIHAME